MRKIFAVMSLLVVASMLITACGTAAPAEPVTIVQTVVVEGTPKVVEVVATPAPETKPAALRVNMGTYPDVIDPQKSSYVNEIATLKQIYQGLTTFNEKLETVPGMAEKWAYNADATELTFTLKKDQKYSDGSPINAMRFEYAVQRNIDPTTAGEYASITDEILNAPEWRAADTAAADYKREDWIAKLGVKASHADGAACADYADAACDTLKLTFSKPAPYFHTIMGIWVAYPAKQENIEEGGELWWNSSKFQVGNGPFIMDVVEPFVRQHFVPNATFSGPAVPTYELEYRYITDGAVSFEAFKNGELDIIALGGEDLATVQADPNLKAMHMQYAGSCTTLIKFGLAAKYTGADGKEFDSPFIDKKVREAFALAFDAAGWSKDVDAGLSAPTWTWIPPGYPGYDAASPLKFDVAAAKAALDASTYGPGPDKLNALGLKLTFGDTPRNRQRSEWLVAKYKENLGVDIALDPIDATTFTAITKDPNTFPLLARQGWCADYPDPQNWLSVYWRSDTTFAQRMGYKNEEFDKLTKQADGELDPAKRMDLYKQAQQLLLADIPSAFGYNSTNSYMVQPWVKGVTTTPQDSDWAGSMVPWAITIDTSMQK
jgi:oligopeptide transport system substrate-binding protein